MFLDQEETSSRTKEPLALKCGQFYIALILKAPLKRKTYFYNGADSRFSPEVHDLGIN